MYGPYWVILLMFESHDMRHTCFRRLTVVNGNLGLGASHIFFCFYLTLSLMGSIP